MKRIYLDYAATTPVHPDVVKAMVPYFTEMFGNPSSIYSFGQEARSALDESRSQIAGFIGANEEEVVFTSGGSESDNFALKGVAFAHRGKKNHIIISPIEHHAVTETCKFLGKSGFDVTYLPVDKFGMVDPFDVKRAITSKTLIVSIMHANNEVGTIEPLHEISQVTREAEVYFHTDAVQTVGHIPVNVDELGVDLLSMSAHKLYGPKGVGALYIRKGTRIISFMHGGAQERELRAGTENIAGIVGFTKAVALASLEMDDEARRLIQLRDQLVKGITSKIDNTYLNGHPVKRLPNNANITIEFMEGESTCLNLDLEGICVSTGSACSTSSLEPSPVLIALGIPPEKAHSSIRFTLGKWTNKEDIGRVLEVLPKISAKLRSISPLFKQ
jgi:cysteine desulfurase